MSTPVTVAWITDFPVEWLSDLPSEVRDLPRQKPATWAAVLLGELEQNPDFKIHVVVLRKNIPRDLQFERHGVSFHLMKVPGGSRVPSVFWVDTFAVRRALRRFQPALVHAWGSERGASLVALRLGLPHVITIQGLMTWYREVVPVNVFERFAAWVEERSFRQARLVTAESTFTARFISERHRHLRVRHAEHVANWVFHRVVRRPQTDPIRLMTVGGADYRKGTDLLLRAVAALPPSTRWELLVVGKDDARFLEPLRRGLPPSLWERVAFRSGLTQAEIARELARATLFVMPSRADTGPMAVKEAVVAGVPVVGSRVGGGPDYVVPGKNGFLCEPDNLNSLVQALSGSVTHPLFSQGKVEADTLSTMRDYLSPATMARQFVAVYREALGGGSADSPMTSIRPER